MLDLSNIVFFIGKRTDDLEALKTLLDNETRYIRFDFLTPSDLQGAIYSIGSTIQNDAKHYTIVIDETSCISHEEVLKTFRGTFIPNNVIDAVEVRKLPNCIDNIKKNIQWIFSDFRLEKKSSSKIWFTSDTHFNHEAIIKYCNRPFKSVDEMNETLISNWNQVVKEDDVVWHLGDFCLGKDQKQSIPELVNKLNGKINLVLGNHDHHGIKFYYDAGFNRVYDRKVILNDFIILSHAPMSWVQEPFFNCFGHVHQVDMYKTFSKTGCCVCVERHNYKPISLEEIQTEVDKLRE